MVAKVIKEKLVFITGGEGYSLSPQPPKVPELRFKGGPLSTHQLAGITSSLVSHYQGTLWHTALRLAGCPVGFSERPRTVPGKHLHRSP